MQTAHEKNPWRHGLKPWRNGSTDTNDPIQFHSVTESLGLVTQVQMDLLGTSEHRAPHVTGDDKYLFKLLNYMVVPE